MTSIPTYTPYDGSAKLFAVGLRPLDLSEWIEIDDTYDEQMREKRRLFATCHEDVFVEEPDSGEAQREVLTLIRQHVRSVFPDRFARTNDEPASSGVILSALHAASLLVQEDLILMRRGDDGWRLAAGALCFPSSWILREKFGRHLQDIHAPVPNFGRGTRNADMIERMFDNLRVEHPVQRFNWSLQARHELYYPLSDTQRNARANRRPSKFDDLAAIARGFVRVERQTLRKLPLSGDILFTIRIYLDPLGFLHQHPDGSRIAASFAGQLMALDPAQLDYKGLTADRDRLAEFLRSIGPG